MFRLSGAFGHRAAAEVTWVRMPYLHSTAAWKCVDDPASRHYNRLVDETSVERDLEGVVRWLDPARSPALMQLPRDEYRRHQRAWRLP